MIEIRNATEADAEILALLGTTTYIESHGHFLASSTDLNEYVESTFSVSKTKEDLNDLNSVFFIIFVNELPVGYAKLLLNSRHEDVKSRVSCKLEKIYILAHFIPLRIGQKFLDFIISKMTDLQVDTIWLTVYKENKRAIGFYLKNNFQELGTSTFMVNGSGYENIVFARKIEKQ